jgi:DNA polymerase III sliding clamp (beta) subunit (PCNA family)
MMLLMDKASLLELQKDASQRFAELARKRDEFKAQWENTVLDMNKVEGEYNAYSALLNQFPGEDKVVKRKSKEKVNG